MSTRGAWESAITHEFKPYPRMKDSRTSWLGEVPAHWDVVPMHGAYRPRLIKNVGLVETKVLSLSYGQIVVKPEEKLHGLVPESFEGYQIVEIGNIIVRATDLQNDRRSLRVGIVPEKGIITSAYMCLETCSCLAAEYGYMVLHAYDLMKILYGFGSGLRQNLDFHHVKRMLVPVPPADEQLSIARFLVDAEHRIGRFVKVKHRLIELLEEQKQAIIDRAVTRGLDPSMCLKPSSVDWLGDIPEHWEVKRLKHVITPIEQGWSPQCDAVPAQGGEWGVLKVGCVNRDTFEATQNKKLPSTLQPIPALEVRGGDILVSRANTQELVGLAALAVEPRPMLMLCDKLFRFRGLSNYVDSRFLVYAIRCKSSRAQIESSANGASDSMQNIGQPVVRNLFVSLPPLDEQRRVVATLADQTASLTAAISRCEKEISLVREYRARLIADVVTGKLDVRATAAESPVSEDMAPLSTSPLGPEQGGPDALEVSQGVLE
jgi:type I restriction enzyme S subunit